MGRRGVQQIAQAVLAQVAADHRDNPQVVRFHPAQFVPAVASDPRLVLEAMLVMASGGVFNQWSAVRCPEGHLLVEDDPDRVMARSTWWCGSCFREYSHSDIQIAPRFTLTETISALVEKKNS